VIASNKVVLPEYGSPAIPMSFTPAI
jgi:hypothetical protein